MGWIEPRETKDGVRYRVKWRDPAGGTRSQTFARKVDAQRRLVEVEHLKNTGGYRDPAKGRIPLDEMFGQFMNTSPALAPSTRTLYEMHFRVHIAPALGNRPLDRISVLDVKGFLADRTKAGVGAHTVGAIHRLLRTVLNAAVTEERITKNPAVGIKPP